MVLQVCEKLESELAETSQFLISMVLLIFQETCTEIFCLSQFLIGMVLPRVISGDGIGTMSQFLIGMVLLPFGKYSSTLVNMSQFLIGMVLHDDYGGVKNEKIPVSIPHRYGTPNHKNLTKNGGKRLNSS